MMAGLFLSVAAPEGRMADCGLENSLGMGGSSLNSGGLLNWRRKSSNPVVLAFRLALAKKSLTNCLAYCLTIISVSLSSFAYFAYWCEPVFKKDCVRP
jgi:hypothetical protein